MRRIKELWLSSDFPTAADVEDLGRAVGGIRSDMEAIKELAASQDFPVAEQFEDLRRAVGGIRSDMEAISPLPAVGDGLGVSRSLTDSASRPSLAAPRCACRGPGQAVHSRRRTRSPRCSGTAQCTWPGR